MSANDRAQDEHKISAWRPRRDIAIKAYEHTTHAIGKNFHPAASGTRRTVALEGPGKMMMVEQPDDLLAALQ